ncbi:hypothetical protein GCM10023258_23950 [Terrabacter aeriphilus]|uniref:ATP-grasp domain-containing protein n=1 Tax=Terrabacter aeriphilus TaxID=515662 RepID=A0ABP9JF85_9MICO
MRLTFITVRRVPDLPSPLLEEVTVLLRRAGHDVEHRRAEDTVFDATVRGTGGDRAVPADLYLLKSHSELALSLAGALHDRGARLLNPFPSCALTQDKVRATQLLHTAGVPVPQTRVVSGLRAAAALFEGAPLVVKPVRGHRGSGVRLVRDLGDVEGWDESVDTEGGCSSSPWSTARVRTSRSTWSDPACGPCESRSRPTASPFPGDLSPSTRRWPPSPGRWVGSSASRCSVST